MFSEVEKPSMGDDLSLVHALATHDPDTTHPLPVDVPLRTPVLRPKVGQSPKTEVGLRSSHHAISQSTFGPTLSMSLSVTSMLPQACMHVDEVFIQHDVPDVPPAQQLNNNNNNNNNTSEMLTRVIEAASPNAHLINHDCSKQQISILEHSEVDGCTQEDERRWRLHQAVRFFQAFRTVREHTNQDQIHVDDACDVLLLNDTVADLSESGSCEARQQRMRQRMEPSECTDPRRYAAIGATLSDFLVSIADTSNTTSTSNPAENEVLLW